MNLRLRAWQSKFVRQFAAHPRDDFLLVACPAAGKTIAAGAAVAEVMAARDCDQLIVVCPTVVVRGQWVAELGGLGYRMRTYLEHGGWPEHVHGVCTTYAQVASRTRELAAACEQRRTVVIFDEIHHAGEGLAWGNAIATAFGQAEMRLMLSGTPFRSDADWIPYVRYADDGTCIADFAYDYPRAVRDGVCRPIEFRAHDGQITWLDGEEHRSAKFSDRIPDLQHARRLRASLDPAQPYLRALLEDAQADLLTLRKTVPDAAGLVVCDSQLHALEVDRLLSEITGEIQALAMSDIPRAHEAIASFAGESTPWLVSVRMVAEGVDIPRLAIIAWATTARTELIVRQVAGRALRGRGDYAALPAIVHMPADPQLIDYGERIDVLAGVSSTSRTRGDRREHRERDGRQTRTPPRSPATGGVRRVNPTPFVEWFDQQAEFLGQAPVIRRCGWDLETGQRKINRWRQKESGDTLDIFDACHFAGIDFDVLFDGDEYAEARAFIDDPGGGARLRLGAIEAQPAKDCQPQTIAPDLPTGRLHRAAEETSVEAPVLPPSPQDLADAARARTSARAELFRLLSIYSQLRRSIDPGYQLASAHGELAVAVGTIRDGSPDEQIAEATEWARGVSAALAARYPEHVKQLARTRRRQTIARQAA